MGCPGPKVVTAQGWRSGPDSERQSRASECWVALCFPPLDAQSHFLNEAWPGPLTWVAPALFDINDTLPPGCGEMGHPSLGLSVPA